MIGYYVHHQGRGHLHRAVCVARHLRLPVTGFSSLPRPAEWPGDWVRLPLDTGGEAYGDTGAGAGAYADAGAGAYGEARGGTGLAGVPAAPSVPALPGAPVVPAPPSGADPTARGRLHWVPRHHPGLRDRMGAIAAWVTRTGPRLFVSDVSVEVALLARLMGVPVAVAAMRGDRSDPAHRLGYDLADALLAPWPDAAPEPDWPSHWREKTLHTGAFSRYDGRARVPATRPADGRREVVVLLGAGGTDVDAAALRKAADSTTGWTWTFLGGPEGRWTDDPWPLLCRADAVVTHAGQNAIAECAAARTPAVVIPQDRPHGEQHATARALAAAGLATVRTNWPDPEEWQTLLDRTARRPGDRWALWAPGDGARRAARLLERLAAAPHGRETACASR
ncbi:glycosyltransferase [Streptomyces sp. CC224B]|uniref:glycosyltransferase n=1 Tax=Streptomyces sp. CC224B TaxID=3044571 RepID=UPI0024A88795|nr:glycosyltransferase [Streptomyces sp. CC224B]